jgi:serine O-acetyltransferase
MKDELSAQTIATFIEIRKNSRSIAELKAKTERWIVSVIALIFPQLSSAIDCDGVAVVSDFENIWQEFSEIEQLIDHKSLSLQQAADALLVLREQLLADAQAALEGDPAAQSLDEIILAYPGFRALAFYRVAHVLHSHGYPLIPRIITERAHHETGIDIHPAAKIGSSCFIDHGTGVVIGETAIIGDRVKIYQGVTLGALSVSKDLANTKRHPTVEDDVVLYANAIVLGGETVIGARSIIGGNSWITESVPPDSFIKRQP